MKRALLLTAAFGCAHPSADGPLDSSPTLATAPSPELQVAYPSRNALWADPAQHDFSDNPGLLDRILESPHGYFRFINRRFAQAVCRRFREHIASMPTVNLHGDTHLEQYAVTSAYQGLVDFDDATTGPPVLDLMRIGVSIHLTARERGWTRHRTAFFESVLDGYAAALERPDAPPPVPAVAKALEAKGQRSQRDFLDGSTKLMEPLDPVQEQALRKTLGPAMARLAKRHPGHEPDFFAIKRVGGFGLGIGSALSEKYLVRIEGDSQAPLDDVILEVKELKDLSEVNCVDGPDRIDPIRVLAVRSRIATEAEPFLGHARMGDRAFWIHGWDRGYRELDVSDDMASPEELAELLYAIGFQLGRGHPQQIASPRDDELREDLEEWVRAHRGKLHQEVERLEDQVYRAWQAFSERVTES
ncbi:MAG: DUF2252 family protein [Myxococcota bacterium]